MDSVGADRLEPKMTMRAARAQYFRDNGFPPDGGYADAWVDFKLGPLPMPFPNTEQRRRAVRFHDLHHVITGYATNLTGEAEIAAWELASGCADHIAAWYLNLNGLAIGAVIAPLRTWGAFVRGRYSENVYRRPFDDSLLDVAVLELRDELGVDRASRAAPRARDGLAFAAFLAVGCAVAVPSLAIGFALAPLGIVTALVRRATT
jgi:hypothetical protein